MPAKAGIPCGGAWRWEVPAFARTTGGMGGDDGDARAACADDALLRWVKAGAGKPGQSSAVDEARPVFRRREGGRMRVAGSRRKDTDMRTLLMGVAAVAMTAGVAAAQMQQGQQEQPAPRPSGQQGGMMGQGMGPGMMGGYGMGQGMGPGMMGGYGGYGMMGQGMMGHPMHDDDDRGMDRHMMLMMFALADQDGNGKLSLEEVQAVHARLFKYADTDHDGSLTMKEIAAFMHGGPGLGGDADN